jgi:hypothetical protein
MEIKAKVLTLLILSCISAVFAEDFKTTDGKEYKDVTITRVEPDGIVIKNKSGIAKLYFAELPKEVQDRFHYNAGQAAAYSGAQAAQVAQTNTVQALEARYQELLRQEDNLELTIGQAEVGTYGGYENPLRSQLPYLHSRLDEVRREKDQVSKDLEKAQRQKQ